MLRGLSWGSGDCYIQKDSLQHLETVDMCSQMEFCIILTLTPRWFLTFCPPGRRISPATRVNCARNSHVWDRDTTGIPLIFMPTLWKMNPQPTQKMFLCERDVVCVTSMVEHPVIVAASSHTIWLNISLTDWSWQCAEVTTMVSGSEPIRSPCLGLHESHVHDVCAHGEHWRTTVKCINAGGGLIKKLAWIMNRLTSTFQLTNSLNTLWTMNYTVPSWWFLVFLFIRFAGASYWCVCQRMFRNR